MNKKDTIVFDARVEIPNRPKKAWFCFRAYNKEESPAHWYVTIVADFVDTQYFEVACNNPTSYIEGYMEEWKRKIIR